jgi:hypothetical protein
LKCFELPQAKYSRYVTDAAQQPDTSQSIQFKSEIEIAHHPAFSWTPDEQTSATLGSEAFAEFRVPRLVDDGKLPDPLR